MTTIEAPASTRPLTPSTLIYGFTTASDPQISPDGTLVAYVVSKTDAESKKGSSQIWMCAIDGSNPRQITHSGQRNGGPRWSPDGKSLAFVSDRVEKAGLFVLPMGGGEAREVTRYHSGIGDLAWSPDGTRIAFTASVDPSNPAGEKPQEGTAPKVRVTSRIDYKQDNRGYLDDVRTQVFVVDIATAERTQVTTEAVDHNFPAWSPDGKWLAAGVPNRNGMAGQLELIPLDGGDGIRIGSYDGTVGTWTWTPGGESIVFSGEQEMPRVYQPDFYAYDLGAGRLRRITSDLHVVPDAGFPTVMPAAQPVFIDDRRLLFHAFRAGASGIYELDIETGAVEHLEGELELRAGLSVDARRQYGAQSAMSLERFGEICVVDLQARERRLLTSLSEPVFAETPPARWERLDVTRNGFTIEAWVLKPPDFDPSKRHPVVIDIHGGPNGYYGYAFNPIQQLLATNGYVVVYSNPRGSTSYGREFARQVVEDWGGEDYQDLMAVMDRVCEEPYVDAGRQGIWGYSYGGYMTAWTIAQNHRFKAAVCGAPCFDLEAMYGTSDISHTFGPLQWGGPPHEAREWYATRSPSQIAHNTRTPTLIIQGEEDHRCPVGQGEAMFVALKQAGCEVEFARYPGGSHLFMRGGPPEHREDVLARTLAWFERYLKE
ncbi:MAG TPA: S9 family peptidase [Tepidiformaceae bacterium]|nr:S9 family peptidase [Tepidiformaceae bacterium]